MILKLLKMSIDKDRLVKDIRRGRYPSQSEQKEKLALVRRLGSRIESQISALQEEHRILKRPFILGGKEYISEIKSELFQL
jgi:arsenate reductase-like glutaredoxin family protein